MKQTLLSASRLGSLACLLVLHLCTVTASRAAILAGPITNAANGHIYYLLSPTNWPSAEAEAVSLHGHLATINDVAENTWVFNTFASYGGIARTLWLGLNDAAQEGQWVWVSGEAAAYRNWAPGEPNNGGDYFPDEDQAVMRGPALAYSDSWNDAPGDQVHAAVVEVAIAAPPTNTGAYDVASGFSTNSNPNGVWSYGSSATLGGPMTLLPDRGNWAGLDYWRAAILLGVPGVYHNPASISVTNNTGTAILGPGQLSFYPGPNGEFCIIRFSAPTNGLYQVSGAFTGVDPHGTTTDVHVLVNGVIFNGSVNGYGAGSGPAFNLIVDLNTGDPVDFAVGRSTNSQFSFDSTGLSVHISTSNAPPAGIPPTITSQPQSRTVNAGTNVTFFVTVTGTAPLSYQWRRNETNLAGATGTSLTLSNVQPANAGNYSVRVTNAFGSVISSNAVLTVLAPATNCVSAPTGLVSWWRAESNAVDSVDSNHGTLAGNATFGVGRVGQGFVFDGNRDGVNVGTATNLQLQDFSIESWVKRTSATMLSFNGNGGAQIFALGAGGGGYGFYIQADGYLALGKLQVNVVTSAARLTDTNWHHVAVTKLGTAVVFYVDGVAYAGPAYDSGGFTYAGPGYIGAWLNPSGLVDNSFYGAIDELAIYNRTLSGTEIQAIYAAGNAGKCGSAAGVAPAISGQPQSQTVPSGTKVTITVSATGTAPLSYQWRRNGTNLAGATGTSLTLSNVQPANAGTYSVRVTNAFGAVTSSNAVLTVLATPSPILAGPITNAANGHVYYLIASNTWTGAEAQAVNLGGHLVTINDATENAWVLSTFGSFGGLARPLWIGLNDAAVEGAFVWVSGEPAAYRNWMPGEPNNGGGFVPDEDYVGMRGPALSFSNAWNDTLNSDLYVGVVEIGLTLSPTNCVSAPAGLVSWWRAEGNEGDDVGGNHGTLLNGATFGAGRVGQGFSFDGVDDRVVVANSPSLKFSTNDFAIEGWIQAFPASSYAGIMSILDKHQPSSDGAVGIQFYLQNGRLSFYMSDAPPQPLASSIYNSPSPNLQDGQFHHVAVTVQRQSSTGGKLYVDGQVVLTFNPTSQPGNLSNTEALRIGNHADPSLNCFFKGTIDELAIYNRTLAASEIQAIHNAGVAGKCVVSHPPTITSHPTNKTISVSQGVIFTVSATGTAPLRYQWRRNETNLAGATGTSLILSNVQPANAGTYSVRVTNTFGAVTSSNAVLTVLAPLTNCVSAPAGLVSWWRAEGNASDAADGNHATLLNGATFGAGRAGLGFSLDGVDDRVVVADSPSLKFSTNDFAIEGWIQAFPAANSFGLMSILDKHQTPSTYSAVGIQFYLQDGRLSFFMADAPLQPYAYSIYNSASPNLQDGQFHHVAVTVQRQSSTGGKLYVDGQVVLTFNPTSEPGDLSNTEALRIGNHANPDLACFFKGTIDEVTVYNRALGSNEIAAIYAAGSAGKCSPPRTAGAIRLTSLVCESGTNAKLCFGGIAGSTYTIQASTNLIDWKVVGVSVADSNGICEFEDLDSTEFPCRYYRVVVP